MYIRRYLEPNILKSIQNFPVTAVTGPRQCGKSTLVKHLLEVSLENIYLDLERPSDLRKLEDAKWLLTYQKDKLICIDEIQRKPELFPLIQSLVDEWNHPGCFLFVSSALQDLLRQILESLAGRISYKKLTPLLWNELENGYSVEKYFSAGSFPGSLLNQDNEDSFEWRENFVTNFLERDLLQWAGFTPSIMRRLWQMLAHLNGQMVNYSTLATPLGITSTTVKNYIDVLAGIYMIEIIPPNISNLGKRLVKVPKVYVSDSGVTAALLGLRSFEDLSGYPAFGSLWEQIVLSNLKGLYPETEFFYYRTTNDAETDFVMRINKMIIAFECKSSYSPVLSKGNYLAFKDINPKHILVVTPSSDN